MICYGADIGFAIGRLISVFYDMACQLAGNPADVHFSFASSDRLLTCRNLPSGFSNVIAYDYRRDSTDDTAALATYVREKGISTAFALDMAVDSLCLPALRRAGVSHVVSYWGAPMSSMNSGWRLIAKRLEVALLRRHKPDHFIFESRAMRDFAVGGRGLSRASTSVVHTGVDAERFSPRPNLSGIVHERFGVPRGAPIVVYMGHLHRRKGVHVLMRAMEHVVAEMGRSDVYCLFLGNSPGEEHQFQDCFDRAAPRLIFGGYQSDVPDLLAGCFVGCIPSTGWDSFPMSSIEMQACGVPVVVSDWQGVPETVADGSTGIVVPSGNAEALARALVSLIDEPRRREQMSLAARLRVEASFTRAHQVANLVNDVRRRL